MSCSRIISPSNFLERFSFDDTIKELNGSGLRLSISGSGTTQASAGDPSPHRREVISEYEINETVGESFDERTFLDRLSEAIQQQARNSGAKINGSGKIGGETFYINYKNGSHVGGVDVIGIRTGKNKYKMWCVIRELASEPK